MTHDRTRVLRALFLCSLCWTTIGYGEETVSVLSPEHTHEIFVEAARVSGYALPDVLPEIRILPLQQFIAEVCPEDPHHCPGALSLPGKPILMSDVLNPEVAADRSYFVHEAVHTLQYHAKQIADLETLPCEDMLALEREAYYAQQRYLDRNGQLLRVTHKVYRMGCDHNSTLSFW